MYDDLKYWYLKDHKLFRTLNSSELKQLCVILGFKKARKGDTIYFSDSEVPRIFFLKSGTIKIVTVDEEGKEVIKDIIQKGDLFGELSFDHNNENHEIAKVASENVTLCSFLLSDFEELMLKKPQLALSYTKIVGLKLKNIRNNYNNLIFKDVKQRLKLFLIDWTEREGKKSGEQYLIDNYLTQNDIAQIICTSRQTATSLLSALESEGIIVYDRKEIIVKDFEKLKQL